MWNTGQIGQALGGDRSAARQQMMQKPMSKALSDALNAKGDINVMVHPGEMVIPRAVFAANSGLYGQIAKAFDKMNEQIPANRHSTWTDYIAGYHNPRRVFDVDGESASHGGATDTGIDEHDGMTGFGHDASMSGAFSDTMGEVGGYGNLGFGGNFGFGNEGLDSLEGMGFELGDPTQTSFMDIGLGFNDPVWGTPYTVGRGIMSTIGKLGLGGPAFGIVGALGSLANHLGAVPSTDNTPGQPGGGPGDAEGWKQWWQDWAGQWKTPESFETAVKDWWEQQPEMGTKWQDQFTNKMGSGWEASYGGDEGWDQAKQAWNIAKIKDTQDWWNSYWEKEGITPEDWWAPTLSGEIFYPRYQYIDEAGGWQQGLSPVGPNLQEFYNLHGPYGGQTEDETGWWDAHKAALQQDLVDIAKAGGYVPGPDNPEYTPPTTPTGDSGVPPAGPGVEEWWRDVLPEYPEGIFKDYGRPDMLNQFGSADTANLDPLQLRTAIATNAMYGGGGYLSNPVLQYYGNLVEGGGLNYGNLTPVEQQYLARMGLNLPINPSRKEFLEELAAISIPDFVRSTIPPAPGERDVNAIPPEEYISDLDEYFMQPFNPSAYLANNPDVQEALNAGLIPSAYSHYLQYGIDENRPGAPGYVRDAEGRPIPIDYEYDKPSGIFDEMRYLEENPDVYESILRGEMPSGLFHYMNYGANEDWGARDAYGIFGNPWDMVGMYPAGTDTFAGDVARGFTAVPYNGSHYGLADALQPIINTAVTDSGIDMTDPLLREFQDIQNQRLSRD